MSIDLENTESIHYLDVGQNEAAVMTVESNPRKRRSQRLLQNAEMDNLFAEVYEGDDHKELFRYKLWGHDNLFPVHWMKLVLSNNIAPGISEAKADFISGKRLIVYKEHLENGKIIPEFLDIPEIEDFFEENESEEYIQRCASDIVYLGNSITEFQRAKSRTKIPIFNHIDMTTARAGVMQMGKINEYFFNDWYNDPSGLGQRVDAFDKKNPFRFPNSIYHVKRYTPGSYHYGLPDIGMENWLRLANQIPRFHFKGLKNQYNIRWHIEIPYSYFEGRGLTDEEEKDEVEALRSELSNYLAGVENVGKAAVTFYKEKLDGTPGSGIKITPLKPELFDDAFLQAYEAANIAISSGAGIDPSIAGVMRSTQLSSGSDKRISYDMYLKLKVPQFRKRLLQPLYALFKANGWNEKYGEGKRLKIGMVDYELTTLDEQHKGGQVVVNTGAPAQAQPSQEPPQGNQKADESTESNQE